MPVFRYEAADGKGAMRYDIIDAPNKNDALLLLSKKGLIPVSIEEEGKRRMINVSLNTTIFERVTAEDRITLVRNLAVTLRAGLSVLEAMDILIVDTPKKALKDIMKQAEVALQKGQPLSRSFARYPKYFSPVFTGLMEAGEASGHLEQSLEQLAEQMSKEYRLLKKVKSAMAYPVILLVASFAVLVMLLVVVLPRLAKSFMMSGVQLPTVTKVVLAVSGFVASHFLLLAFLFVALVLAFNFVKKTEKGNRFLLKTVMRIPVVSELVKKVALVRFSRNLSSLIASGINIIDALTVTADTVGNIIYKEKILNAVSQIKNGLSLSDTLKDNDKLFPHLLLSMMAVGEKTGTMEYVLKTFADFYDEEVDGALKDLTTFLEPVMLLLMGLIIGLIAMSILLPIYQLIGKFA